MGGWDYWTFLNQPEPFIDAIGEYAKQIADKSKPKNGKIK